MADKPTIKVVDAGTPVSLDEASEDLMREYEITVRLRGLMAPEELARLDSFDPDGEQEAAQDEFINAMAKKYRLVGSA